MNKLAVIFPGVGYHTDKPLLYYSKKLAFQNGYEIVEGSKRFQGKDGKSVFQRSGAGGRNLKRRGFFSI